MGARTVDIVYLDISMTSNTIFYNIAIEKLTMYRLGKRTL